jgi:fructose-1,6-bisphosphatase/inositol monophosphatase family enzyme
MTSSVSTWSAHQLSELQRAGGHLRTWGDAYGYALVATGRAEAMVDPVAELWDLAPMPVIIGEAGGRFSSVGGSSDPAAGSGVASCDGPLHDELLAILER